MMADVLCAGLTGGEVTLPARQLEELRTSLRGDLVQPGDADYDAARRVWNQHIDKHPALVARCVGPADVMACVDFARENGVLVAVRGGAHNFGGTSVADRGLVIDLSRMTSVRVDPVGRTARAEGGTKWGQYDRETQAFGLASTGGTNSDTGIAGLTLGGGLGWLAGKYGLALDNLLSADVVTADGRLRVASAEQNPDLFWAIRGGGGNFGVVTSFEYRLHEVDRLLTGLFVHPLARAADVLRFYDELVSNLPDEATTAGVLAHLPGGGPPIAAFAVCYNGDLAKGEEFLRPLARFGEPMVAEIELMTYAQVQHWVDDFTPDGQWYETGHLMAGISDAAADTLYRAYREAPSPGNLILFQQLGNAANRVPADATAFAHRAARYGLVLAARWDKPDDAEGNIAWTRALRTAVAPHATGGVYVNAVGRPADDGPEVVRSAYGANHARLAELKRTYDPANLFRHNQNIEPV
jgi:FAD/FMN-containing dehydrogenase